MKKLKFEININKQKIKVASVWVLSFILLLIMVNSIMPFFIKMLTMISQTINQIPISSANPEYKLLLLFVGLYIILKVIVVIIEIYTSVANQLTKTINEEDDKK